MKKILSLFTILLLIFASVPTFAFSDVKKNDWFEPFVQRASEQGLVKGYTDGSFKPRNNITVSEFISITLSALESKGAMFDINYAGAYPGSSSRKINETNQYTVYLSYDLPLGVPKIIHFDVSTGEAILGNNSDIGIQTITNIKSIESKWYYKSYLSAIGTGLILSEDFKISDLERKITRAEIALITNNALGLLQEKQKATKYNSFVDSIDKKFEPSVQNLYEEKIMLGFTGNTFKPNKAATRAEAVVVILNLVDYSARK